MDSAKHVFISHAAENKPFAARLAVLMSERGASVYLDANDLVGDSWSEAIRGQLEKASALVLVIPSDDVPNRNNLWFEAGAARALGKRVLAVLPPEARMSTLPRNLADVFILDADSRSIEEIAATLVQAVPQSANANELALADD